MKVIKEQILVPFDVDGTLISYDIEGVPEDELITVGFKKEFQIKVLPIKKHIDKLKSHKASGHLVLVWSGSGWRWAEHIIKRLKLSKLHGSKRGL